MSITGIYTYSLVGCRSSSRKSMSLFWDETNIHVPQNCIQTFENKILGEIVLHWLATTSVNDMSLPSSIHAVQRLMDVIARFALDFTDDDCKREFMKIYPYRI